MKRRRFFVGAGSAFALGACSTSGKFKTYDGPEVTQVLVMKERRKMYLLHEKSALRSYPINLGFQPEGNKLYEGDGRTPEGLYMIDRRNPNSRYHLSLGISYPNEKDIAQARALGRNPGGDIFIHGQLNPMVPPTPGDDWTWGCIAVSNREMEEVYAMVTDGTPIFINA